ncbi:hypothetical protein AVEN_212644-1 [Araneus ventricosus]|uniref:Uncharacterized protein n=1 Tax=Araneus ventricosus TaxID=182803 RepID=A0A4Y2MC91_ARAVE|nr:hypothetical protein AVEN_212644-1 [Araneus ventricosus]
MLDEIQATFSAMTFVIVSAYLSFCFALLGQIMHLNYYSWALLTETTFSVACSIVFLIAIFWFPGRVSLELKTFSHLIRTNYEERCCAGFLSENFLQEKLLLEQRSFLFSGLNLISYKRENILTLLGALLTYGLLVLSVESRA